MRIILTDKMIGEFKNPQEGLDVVWIVVPCIFSF